MPIASVSAGKLRGTSPNVYETDRQTPDDRGDNQIFPFRPRPAV
jgi:hypothetical protein